MIQERVKDSHIHPNHSKVHKMHINNLVTHNKKYQLPYYKSLNENRIVLDSKQQERLELMNKLNKEQNKMTPVELKRGFSSLAGAVTQVNVVQMNVNTDSLSFLDNKNRSKSGMNKSTPNKNE